MFTGIVQDCVPVVRTARKPGLLSFAINFPKILRAGLKRGASVAVDGVCLTMVDIKGNAVWFEAMAETLQRTTLGTLKIGRKVNMERSAQIGDELGGHLLSGHISGAAKIIKVHRAKNNMVMKFQIPAPHTKYLFPKGFIALDGVSLTTVNVDRVHHTCTVALIPETLRRTTFGFKKVGDYVNLEIDTQTQAIVDTVESYLTAHLIHFSIGN